MKDVMQSQGQVIKTIQEAIGKIVSMDNNQPITDIYLQPIQGTGELCVFDDDDHELARAKIVEWSMCVPESFYAEAETLLQVSLKQMESEGAFDSLPILKPYSFVMVDESGETLVDLLLIDDDTMFLTDTLLKGLDKELNEFLEKLMNN